MLVPLPQQTGRGMYGYLTQAETIGSFLVTNMELGLSESMLIEGPICYVAPSSGSVLWATKSHVPAKIIEEQKY